jgi:hypothetical protein
MGSFSEHFRHQVEQYENDLAVRLGRMNRGELVAWCKSEIETHVKLLDLALEAVSPNRVVVNYPDGLDVDGVPELARRDTNWCDALINEVKKRRIKGQEIPSPWRDFALDVLLKISDRPDGRGKKTFSREMMQFVDACAFWLNTPTVKQRAELNQNLAIVRYVSWKMRLRAMQRGAIYRI